MLRQPARSSIDWSYKMNLAEELAARDLTVNIYIRAMNAYITLIKPNGNWAGKSRIPMGADIWPTIAAEVKRLLKGHCP